MGALAAGPPGAIAGAVIGAGAIGSTSWALEADNAERALRDQQLDAEIGVSEGDLGVAGLKHPPAKVGAYSAASLGVGGSSDPVLAEGPILPPPD